jgi:hypothetical protein
MVRTILPVLLNSGICSAVPEVRATRYGIFAVHLMILIEITMIYYVVIRQYQHGSFLTCMYFVGVLLFKFNLISTLPCMVLNFFLNLHAVMVSVWFGVSQVKYLSTEHDNLVISCLRWSGLW